MINAFSDVQDQDIAIALLSRGLAEDRLPHALAFTGPAGVGREQVALRLAAQVLASAATSWEDELKVIEAGAHPDYRMIEPDRTKTNPEIKVEAARGLVQFMQQTPSRGTGRVVVLKEAEKLNQQAANGILKVLEEPPKSAHIILLLPDLASVLPTIRSRLIAIEFSPLSEAALRRRVEAENLALDPMTLAYCGGSFDRLVTLNQPETLSAVRRLQALVSGKLTAEGMMSLTQWAASDHDLALELTNKSLSAKARETGNQSWAQAYLELQSDINSGKAYNLDASATWLQVFTKVARL